MPRKRKNVGKIKNFSHKMQAKLVFVFCTIVLLFLALMGRLLYLNETKGSTYAKRVLAQQTYVSSILPYRRGNITDRKGTLFATSERVYNLIFEPKTILSKEQYYKEPTLSALISVFGFSREELNQILTDRPSSLYVVLKKGVTYEERTAFQELCSGKKKENAYIKGVWFEEQYHRTYPLGTVASDLIGFTNAGDVGNGGIEGYYNDELNGVNGREYGYFNSELNLEETIKGAVNGYHVMTTLDADAQRLVENSIAGYQEREGAENVGVILMNPNSGEIYVMASDKGYDLNNPRDLSGYYTESEIEAMSEEEQMDALNKIWRNFCISDAYEPGSTFKPFTVAACLEEATVTQGRSFICDGFETIGGRDIGCVRRSGHGSLNLQESIMLSCNDVMMQISRDLGRTSFDQYQRLFGMGSRTGIDLQGEGYGLIFAEDALNSQELATCSFGQSLTVTMIQMVCGFSSLINGGNYYQPHLMLELTNDAGLTVEEYTPVLVKKTVTKATSDFIREALHATVAEGSAKKASAPGYQVGGKTGTAEKLPREDENYVLSFLGYVGADRPELVIYVVIDQPHVEDQTKCSSAMELASEIISEVCPILGIYPSEPVLSGDGDGTGEDTRNPEGNTDEPGGDVGNPNGNTDEPAGGDVDNPNGNTDEPAGGDVDNLNGNADEPAGGDVDNPNGDMGEPE